MTDTTNPSSDPPSVLIVEDERSLADLYATWLGERYEVRTAYDGADALGVLDETIDVVVLDRRMPGLSGDELLEELRERDLDCRVVVVSAVSPDFDVVGMGFDEYLVKPIDAADLRSAVERLLERAGYDETVLELYQLVATRTALESQYAVSELEERDEYVELLAEISALQREADSVARSFDLDDVRATFRDVGDAEAADTDDETRDGGDA